MTTPIPEDPKQSGDFIIIGPECFSDADKTVIAWAGENYYRACGRGVVLADEGSGTTCVKRVKHPGVVHEDFHGNIMHEAYGLNPARVEIAIPAVGEGVLVNKYDIREAWDEYVLPTQVAKQEMSDPLRTVAACLRVINEVAPERPEIEVVTDEA
jgi:hypothetical protein